MPWTRAEQRASLVEPFSYQEVERRRSATRCRQGGAGQAGSPAVGVSHNIERAQEALLVRGVERLAARPEMDAAA